mgnify:FL=1
MERVPIEQVVKNVSNFDISLPEINLATTLLQIRFGHFVDILRADCTRYS